MECTFCEQTFDNSYKLFQHINTHTITWSMMQEKRQERFKIVDCIPDLRHERFEEHFEHINTQTQTLKCG